MRSLKSYAASSFSALLRRAPLGPCAAHAAPSARPLCAPAPPSLCQSAAAADFPAEAHLPAAFSACAACYCFCTSYLAGPMEEQGQPGQALTADTSSPPTHAPYARQARAGHAAPGRGRARAPRGRRSCRRAARAATCAWWSSPRRSTQMAAPAPAPPPGRCARRTPLVVSSPQGRRSLAALGLHAGAGAAAGQRGKERGNSRL